MDIKEIQTLVELVAKSGIHELELERSGMKIRIVGQADHPAPATGPHTQVVMAAPAPLQQMPQMSFPTPAGAAPAAPAASADAAQMALVEDKLHKVLSPIVGTYFAAASPTAEPFVKLGDKVKKGQVLCIVEAMKVMNEIESDVDGEVVKILAEDGQPVEYNQPLFAIK
jgi:acetyl-CoA carboxylase biotin carboxyl carrier protein